MVAELGAAVPDLGTADLDAAAWRTNVSCWTFVNYAKRCEADLPFGKQDVKGARVEADERRSARCIDPSM